MTRKRSYKQFCPMSYSLDAIGDRWAIMIIRELLYGPRRFTDIRRGLPTLATNLLTQRLKDLEEEGFIQQRDLPPPAATHVYELTPYGESVEIVIRALYLWGIHLMAHGSFQDDHVSFVCSIYSMSQLFNKHMPISQPIQIQVHAEGEIFHACIQEGKVEAAMGTTPEPNLIIETTPKMFLRLIVVPDSYQQALADETVKIHFGDEDLLATFTTYFEIPETPVPERP